MNLLIRRAGKLSEGTTVDPLLGPAAISEQIDRTGVPHAVAMAGLGYVLPDRRVTSEQVEAGAPGDTDSFRLPRGIIVRGSGVETRRWRAPGQQASDLAAEAGVRALRSASLEAGQIDLLLFGSASQDVAEPATANIVQERLGCVRAACFDVKNACCSFLNALDVAHAAIETGRAERVLVTAGEVLSPIAAARIRDSTARTMFCRAHSRRRWRGRCLDTPKGERFRDRAPWQFRLRRKTLAGIGYCRRGFAGLEQPACARMRRKCPAPTRSPVPSASRDRSSGQCPMAFA